MSETRRSTSDDSEEVDLVFELKNPKIKLKQLSKPVRVRRLNETKGKKARKFLRLNSSISDIEEKGKTKLVRK